MSAGRPALPQVVSTKGTSYLGIGPVPLYTTSLKNVSADSDCPAVITKCLDQPGAWKPMYLSSPWHAVLCCAVLPLW